MATATMQRFDLGSDFRSLGDFLVAVYRRDTGLGVDPRLVATAGSDEHHGDSVSRGGASVPVELARQLLRVGQPDDLLGGLTRLPMESARLEIPARTDKDHSSSLTGGITVSRRPETLAISSSRMQLEQIGLNATSLSGFCYVTEEALADSGEAMARYLEITFTDAVRGALINELIRGTGAGEMAGILSSPALVTVAAEGGQSADTINATNVVKMALQTWGYDRAVWIANPDTRQELMEAFISGSNSDRFIYESPSGTDPRPRLLGRPIEFTEHASALGDVGDLIAFVPSEYVIGDRSRDFTDSMHVRFENNERAFRFAMRNDGQPWWRSSLTPAQGGNELSPYVVLAERA